MIEKQEGNNVWKYFIGEELVAMILRTFNHQTFDPYFSVTIGGTHQKAYTLEDAKAMIGR